MEYLEYWHHYTNQRYHIFIQCDYSPRPLRVPKLLIIKRLIEWLAKESNMLLSALAPAAVPIKYSNIRFQPMKKATNSPTVT